MNKPSQIKNTILSQNCLLFSEAYPTPLLIKILSKTNFLSAIFFFLNQISQLALMQTQCTFLLTSQLASVQTQCTFMLTSAWRWFLGLTGVVFSGWLHSHSHRPNSGPNHIHTPAQFWAKTHSYTGPILGQNTLIHWPNSGPKHTHTHKWDSFFFLEEGSTGPTRAGATQSCWRRAAQSCWCSLVGARGGLSWGSPVGAGGSPILT